MTGDGLDAALAGRRRRRRREQHRRRRTRRRSSSSSRPRATCSPPSSGPACAHHVAALHRRRRPRPAVPHYAGKRAQERLVAAGPMPWTHRAGDAVPRLRRRWSPRRTEQDGVATVAPLLMQPIARRRRPRCWPRSPTVAPRGAKSTSPAPRPRTSSTWRGARLPRAAATSGSCRPGAALFDTSMAGEVLLPGPDVRLARSTFDDWLAAGASSALRARRSRTGVRRADRAVQLQRGRALAAAVGRRPSPRGRPARRTAGRRARTARPRSAPRGGSRTTARRVRRRPPG